MLIKFSLKRLFFLLSLFLCLFYLCLKATNYFIFLNQLPFKLFLFFLFHLELGSQFFQLSFILTDSFLDYRHSPIHFFVFELVLIHKILPALNYSFVRKIHLYLAIHNHFRAGLDKFYLLQLVVLSLLALLDWLNVLKVSLLVVYLRLLYFLRVYVWRYRNGNFI